MQNPVQQAAHWAIRGYQLTLSGLIGRQCRHLPSCSDYTDEAIQRHGFWAGGWMGAARICRCGPFGGVFKEDPTEQVRFLTLVRHGRY